MTVSSVRRARALRRFAVFLVLAGLVPVALFVAQALLPEASALPPLPRIGLIPNPQHAAIVFPLIGIALMWLGATMAARQREVFEMDRREREDRLRRVNQYSDGDRREPYIGAAMHFRSDNEPQ